MQVCWIWPGMSGSGSWTTTTAAIMPRLRWKTPVHLGDGSRKVLRGNGWFYVDPDPDMRAANRYRMPPLRWYPYVGVRCATSGTTIAATQVPDPGIESAALRHSDWRQRNRFVQRFVQEGGVPVAGAVLPVDLEEMVLVAASCSVALKLARMCEVLFFLPIWF